VWLHRAGKKTWYTLVPAVIMIITTIAALSYYLFVKYLPSQNLLLVVTDSILLALAVGVLVLSIRELVLGKPRPGASFSA
jgi:hypothetical protein